MIPINILIGDRMYRIKIAPKDEEAVRKAVKVINEQILTFKSQFAGRDMQDYIAMVLVWFATQRSELAASLLQQTALQAKLQAIEHALDTALQVKNA